MALSVVGEPEEISVPEFQNNINEMEQENTLDVETPKTLAIGLDASKENETNWNYEDFFGKQQSAYHFERPPRPWLPPKVQAKIERMKKSRLSNNELVDLFDRIAQISTDFYDLRQGKAVAIKIDGRIAESANSEAELLFKIQGKKFDVPIFAWKVGSSSFAGWRK